MWRSALSWTRWWLTKPLRARLRRQIRARRERQQLLRQALLEALTPLAAALQRQDRLAESRHQQQLEHLKLVQDLQMEVLSSLQPSASQQIQPLLESTPRSFSRRSPT